MLIKRENIIIIVGNFKNSRNLYMKSMYAQEHLYNKFNIGGKIALDHWMLSEYIWILKGQRREKRRGEIHN